MTIDEKERAALARFETMLDAYGAEPRRWPADRRAWAEALVAESAAARTAQADAARLDLLLDASGLDPAPAPLLGRVLAAAPQPRRAARWSLKEMMKPALGLALAAVLGLALGGVVSPFAPAATDSADNEAVSLDIAGISEIDL
ncbi:MAG: hypothetical protein KIT16_18790 [Rhodospirillaceae bacterium]|nr:hypothetical protein [Rhodospirillaceae bacterium]